MAQVYLLAQALVLPLTIWQLAWAWVQRLD